MPSLRLDCKGCQRHKAGKEPAKRAWFDGSLRRAARSHCCCRQQQALHTTTLWHGGDEAANPTATESQSQKCKAQEKVNGKLKPTSSSSTLSADQLMTKNIMRSHRNHQKPLETTTFRNLPSVAWCKDKPQQLRRRTAGGDFLESHSNQWRKHQHKCEDIL